MVLLYYVLTTLLLIISIPILCIYIYFKKCYQYWEKKGVKVSSPPVFPRGSLKNFFTGKSSPGDVFTSIYRECQDRFTGVYMLHLPGLLIKDPELIKCILVKDFNHFIDRGIDMDTKKEPRIESLFVVKGETWKHLRAKLSPTFTSGKLKYMFSTIKDCGEELQKALQPLADNNTDIEIKDFMARYTTDIIASVAFGIQTKSVHNPDSEFIDFGKRVLNLTPYQSIVQGLLFIAPSIVKFLRLKYIDYPTLNFFSNALTETVHYREKNEIVRNDFLQLLIELKNKGQIDSEEGNTIKKADIKAEDYLTMNQLIGQCYLFFIAGFETSSSAMSFCLYELALNPEIQVKLQHEIDRILSKHEEKITYDSINDMEYLDNVLSETLRKYPVLDFMIRVCTKKYQIPDTDIKLEEGTYVLIPTKALHTDPKYFPNPHKFDPDRFLPENKKWNPYSYLPFSEGPRNCIGARMGKIQTKIGLISILQKYNVSVCSKTQIPLVFSKQHIILTTEKEIILKLTNRTNK